jgi:predicted metal-dependent hydrolase
MDYSIQYFKARKTITISINPQGEVIIRAPQNTPTKYIESLVEKKSAWINKKLLYYKSLRKPIKKTYTSGDAYLLFGKDYKLVLTKSPTSSVAILAETLSVRTKHIDDYISVKNALNDFYITTANDYLANRAAELFTIFNHYNLPVPPVHVLKMKGKWGLCTARNEIKLNRDLIKVPKDCIDYVIFHEFCHLLEKNHKQGFYKLLVRYVSNWKLLRKQLQDYGIAALD